MAATRYIAAELKRAGRMTGIVPNRQVGLGTPANYGRDFENDEVTVHGQHLVGRCVGGAEREPQEAGSDCGPAS
jgi:hypothetical protein